MPLRNGSAYHDVLTSQDPRWSPSPSPDNRVTLEVAKDVAKKLPINLEFWGLIFMIGLGLSAMSLAWTLMRQQSHQNMMQQHLILNQERILDRLPVVEKKAVILEKEVKATKAEIESR